MARMTIYFINIVTAFWETLVAMAPYLLFGFFIAGVLSVVISPAFVERHLGTGRWWPIVKASLFGVPLPLCSCSVIPVAMSLHRHGSNRGATTSFLISAPQTGVDSILVTYSLLGWVFAVFRAVAALLSGIFGGFIVSGGPDPAPIPEAEEDHESCCSPEAKQTAWWRRALHHGFIVLPRDIANPLLAGLLIAGLIAGLAPPDLFAGSIGSGWTAKVVVLVIGIPMYVCATATVPIAAALVVAGLSPGAALVFLMSGPATNAATLATIWTVMGRRAGVVYLMSIAVSSLAFGYLLDVVYSVRELPSIPEAHSMVPHGIKVVGAILLIAILLWARYAPKKETKNQEQ